MNSRNNKLKFDNQTFLKDFCLLSKLAPDQQELYQKADCSKIDQEYEASLVTDQKGQRYSILSPIQEFQHHGPGIYLLFKFLKICCILFLIASLFEIANIFLLSQGNTYQLNRKYSQFKIKVGVITYANIKQQYKQLVPLTSFISFVIFTCGIIYWKEREASQIFECSKVKLLPSYYTVILEDIPEGFSEYELRQFLKQFGQIRQIFSVKAFENDLEQFQEMNRIINSFKETRSILKLNLKQENSLKLISFFSKFYDSYKKKNVQENHKYEPNIVFVTFTNIISREILLQTMQNENRICCLKSNMQRQESLYKGQRINFKECRIQPNSINWQNMSISIKGRIWRFIMQVSAISIILLISIIIIYFFSIYQISLVNSKYYSLNREEIFNSNDIEGIKYYCTSLSISKFNSQQVCSQYRVLFIKTFIIQMLLPIIITVLKFIFIKIMNSVVQIRRHQTYIAKIESQIIFTYIFYAVVVGVLQLIANIQVQTQSFNISIYSVIKYCIPFHQYILPDSSILAKNQDYNIKWYFFNSNQVIMISIITFNLKSVFNITYSVFRKIIFKFFAKRQLLNIQKLNYLKGQTIQIQFIYALALNIICFTLLFAPIIPIVWILCLLSLVVLYWASKFIFINFCQRPFQFSYSINRLVVRMTLFTIAICCLIAPLLYGGISGQKVSQRHKKYIYFPILSALIIFYMFFKKYIIILIIKFKSRLQNDIMIRKNRLPQTITITECSNNKLPSYSMHQNKAYQPILQLLYIIKQEQRKRTTFTLNKDISNFIQTLDSKQTELGEFKELIQLIRLDKKKYQKFANNPFTINNKEIQFILALYRQYFDQINQKTIESSGFRRQFKQFGRQKEENTKQKDFIKQTTKFYQQVDKDINKFTQRQLNY